jgi:uncharacterized protein (DUF697 family)
MSTYSSIPPKYRPAVATAIKAATAAGVPGAFSAGADVAGLAVIWGALTMAIADKSGHPIDRGFAANIAGSAIASVTSYCVGIKIAGKLFHIIPGAGTVAAIGISSSLNALFTLKFGQVLVKAFDKPTLDVPELTTTVTIDVLKLFSLWSVPADVAEALELATSFGDLATLPPAH